MNDLCFLYSAKMAVVFILMLLSVATLEAQLRNEKDEFFDLMTAIGEYFGGEFNDAEKALELDLNGANSFLEELHAFATHKIVRKNENGEFECKEFKKPDFIKAIKTILSKKSDKNVRNLLKAFLEKSSLNEVHMGKKLYKKVENFLKVIIAGSADSVKLSDNELYTIKTVLFETFFKKVEDLIKELSVKLLKEKLFNLLFSLAARLEALVHGKNIDGTLKEKEENSKEKIQIFLAVPKCFILPKSELNMFDYWIKIIEMKTQKSQKPIYGVAIYKEKYGNLYKSERINEAFALSQVNYKILKQLNDQKFSIYESSNLLRAAFVWVYHSQWRAENGEPSQDVWIGKIPKIFDDLLDQINSVFYFNWEYGRKNYKCEYAMFFQNVSENLMKMISDKGIDPELHLDSVDKEIREYVQKKVEESCNKFENEKAKIIFLNNVHYELAINFEFNHRKDVYGRAKDLLYMTYKITNFPFYTNRETIIIIEALIEKEHFKQFNLVSLFDEIQLLVEVAIPEEKAKFWKARKEINRRQVENEIEFLKNNPKSIAEEKYQKAVAIICTIKQLSEKVEMLKSEIKTIEIKEQLNELSSKIQNNEMKYFGPELLKQTKEFCKRIEMGVRTFCPMEISPAIEMGEIVFEEELLKHLRFEFGKIWNSFEGVWGGIEEYYLEIPLMQLKEQARPLKKTFGKMLENVKEHYAKKIDKSNFV